MRLDDSICGEPVHRFAYALRRKILRGARQPPALNPFYAIRCVRMCVHVRADLGGNAFDGIIAFAIHSAPAFESMSLEQRLASRMPRVGG